MEDTLPLPKSVHKEYIEDNLIEEFEIAEEDMEFLSKVQIPEQLKRKLRS